LLKTWGMSLKWICSIYYSLCKTILLNVNHCNSMSTTSASAHSTFHCTAANRIPASSAWHAPNLTRVDWLKRAATQMESFSPPHRRGKQYNNMIVLLTSEAENFHSWLRANTILSALSHPKAAFPAQGCFPHQTLIASSLVKTEFCHTASKKETCAWWWHDFMLTPTPSQMTSQPQHQLWPTTRGRATVTSRVASFPGRMGGDKASFPLTRPGNEVTTPGVWL